MILNPKYIDDGKVRLFYSPFKYHQFSFSNPPSFPFQDVAINPPMLSASGLPLEYSPASDNPHIGFSAPSANGVAIGRTQKKTGKSQAVVQKEATKQTASTSPSADISSKRKRGPNMKFTSRKTPRITVSKISASALAARSSTIATESV